MLDGGVFAKMNADSPMVRRRNSDEFKVSPPDEERSR
jgi:hypothetical protein